MNMHWLLLAVMLIVPAKEAPKDDAPDPEDADDITLQLAKVRRIYVDILTGGDPALQFRDLLMTSLQNSKVFIITEDEDRADAVLKGAADDQVFTDAHSSSDGINAHAQLGGGTGATGRTSSNSHYMGMSVGDNESHKSEERKHEAIATIRLVNKDGDVLWSATAESFGGKFLGASADVASKLAKRLATDYKAAKTGAQPDTGKTQAPAEKP